MSRIRRLGFAAIMMVAMLVGGAPAFATEPLTTSGHVTDPDGFLSDEQRETIETPAKSFYSTYSTLIDVAIIPNFSGQEPSAWCKAALKQSRTANRASSTSLLTRREVMSTAPVATQPRSIYSRSLTRRHSAHSKPIP